MDVNAEILLQVMLKMKACQFVVQVVHHRANTSSRLWIRTHHITAVYITPHTQNNFNFHYFIIIHSYFILLFNSKTMLIEIIYFFKYYGVKVTHVTTCIKNITLMMDGLLAKTCW